MILWGLLTFGPWQIPCSKHLVHHYRMFSKAAFVFAKAVSQDVQSYHCREHPLSLANATFSKSALLRAVLGQLYMGKALYLSVLSVLGASLCPSSVHLLESLGAQGVCHFLPSLLHPICSEFRAGSKTPLGITNSWSGKSDPTCPQ